MLQSPISLFLILALAFFPSSSDKFVSVIKLSGKKTQLLIYFHYCLSNFRYLIMSLPPFAYFVFSLKVEGRIVIDGEVG